MIMILERGTAEASEIETGNMQLAAAVTDFRVTERFRAYQPPRGQKLFNRFFPDSWYFLKANFACILAAILILLAAPALFAAARNPEWAQPVEMAGVPNFHKVTDNLYRGAQPSREGFRNLERFGIKTVVNLRSLHHDDMTGTSLAGIRVRMEAWEPETDEVVRAMEILSNPDGAPYFVHCEYGGDRTGLVIAVYRIVFQGWSKDEAIAEMIEGGYGFHSIWTKIPKFVRKMDAEKIKARLKGKDENLEEFWVSRR